MKKGQNIGWTQKLCSQRILLSWVKFNRIELDSSQAEQNWSESLVGSSCQLPRGFCWWFCSILSSGFGILCIIWWRFILFSQTKVSTPMGTSEIVMLVKALAVWWPTATLHSKVVSTYFHFFAVTEWIHLWKDSLQCCLHYSVSTVMHMSCTGFYQRLCHK